MQPSPPSCSGGFTSCLVLSSPLPRSEAVASRQPHLRPSPPTPDPDWSGSAHDRVGGPIPPTLATCELLDLLPICLLGRAPDLASSPPLGPLCSPWIARVPLARPLRLRLRTGLEPDHKHLMVTSACSSPSTKGNRSHSCPLLGPIINSSLAIKGREMRANGSAPSLAERGPRGESEAELLATCQEEPPGDMQHSLVKASRTPSSAWGPERG